MVNFKHIDWSQHGDEIVALYASGLSVREVIPIVEARRGVTYKSGTLTNFLGRRGVLRTKVVAHAIATSRMVRTCELCNAEHVPNGNNQRWCDVCTRSGKYSRRVAAHGIPAIIIEKTFERQRQCCAICDKWFSELICRGNDGRKGLFVDHDHETNQFRGLLCVRCNTRLSVLDDAAWKKRAEAYLKNASEEKDPTFVKTTRKYRYVQNVRMRVENSE